MTIPYSCQDINDADIEEVIRVLRSELITQGPVIEQFETALSHQCQSRYAIAVSSGSAALHCAYASMGIGPGDTIWTSPISFVATANGALHLGARVDFVDVELDTGNISIKALKTKLKKAEESKSIPKAIVVVHYGGQPCDVQQIKQVADPYGIRIIEDACHALGAVFPDGTPIGSCNYSDAAVFSFHAVKAITTGEGGAIVTNDDALAKRAVMLRTHGITRDTNLLQGNNNEAWYYEQQLLGFNYRITDIQAALGLSQLNRLDSFIAKRKAHAASYNSALQDLPLTLPTSQLTGAWHLYPVLIQGSKKCKDRNEVFRELRSAGIGVNVHYIPIHLQPYYRSLGFSVGNFPIAEQFGGMELSLPIHPRMTLEEREYVVKTLQKSIS